jgi:hypothetical protein
MMKHEKREPVSGLLKRFLMRVGRLCNTQEFTAICNCTETKMLQNHRHGELNRSISIQGQKWRVMYLQRLQVGLVL